MQITKQTPSWAWWCTPLIPTLRRMENLRMVFEEGRWGKTVSWGRGYKMKEQMDFTECELKHRG
jgi:hypothetical protein